MDSWIFHSNDDGGVNGGVDGGGSGGREGCDNAKPSKSQGDQWWLAAAGVSMTCSSTNVCQLSCHGLPQVVNGETAGSSARIVCTGHCRCYVCRYIALR